jgi:hypothetical protein
MAIKPIRSKWDGRMTDRERFNNQMHYMDIDRTFNMEFGYWQENFELWPIFKDNDIKSNDEADRFFSFDRFEAIGGNIWMDPVFPNTKIGETDKHDIVMNNDGLLAEVPKDRHDTIPHYIKSSVVTPDDWKKVKAERFRRDDPSRRVDIGKIKAYHKDDRDYPLGVHTGSMIGKIRDMLTFEGLAYAMFDHPDMVEDMVETCCLLAEDYLDQVLPHIKFDFASGWEDIAFKNGPIVSVGFFKDVITPRYKRICRKLHAAGIDIWYTDCDGDVRPILPYMMEGGINCLFPFEVNGCSHPSELFDKYGKELRIMGGFDKLRMRDGKDAIDDYMKSLIPLVKRGGYIPFCDHRCPPDVTPENYLYYLDLKEATFGMS